MKPDDQPTIVSLETHRRKRLADARKRQDATRKQAKAARAGSRERAINWARVPLLVGVVAVFLLFSWLVHQAGGLLNPFH